jgi:hypothetical protein
MTWLATTPAASADRALNAAIADADIRRSYEEYLDIVDRFYSDGIQFASDDSSAPLVGKAQVTSALFTKLLPLHVMAEIAGLRVSVSEKAIPSDSPNEERSEWSLELVGVTGRTVTLTWSIRRRGGATGSSTNITTVSNATASPCLSNDLNVDLPGDAWMLKG